MKKLLRETHRRSVWQVLAVYVGVSWAVLQVVDVLTQNMGLPSWVFPFALVLLLLGLPVMLTTAIIQGRGTGAGAGEIAKPVPEPGTPSSVQPSSASGEETFLDKRRLFTWKNSLLGGAAAATLFATVMGGYAFARRAGLGSAGTLVAKGLIEDGERIILSEFAGDPDMAEAATMAFRVDLSQSPTVNVADPAFISAVLGRMERDPDTPVDEEVALEAAVREGIKAVVAGDVARVGGSYVFTARLVAAESGQDLVNVRENAADSTRVLETIDRLSRRMRERMGESLGSIRASAPLDRATTTSLEALRKYSQALVAIDTGDRDLGQSLLLEAIEIDSTFAMAWRKLAVQHNSQGDDAAARIAAARAYEYRDMLTDRERYMTLGTYHSTVTNDTDASITAYRTLLDQYPNDTWALNNLALMYFAQANMDGANDLLRRAVQLDPYSPNAYINLAGGLHWLGDRDSAVAVIDLLESQVPGQPWVQRMRTELYAAEWDYDAAESQADILVRGTSSAGRRWGLYGQSTVALARGRLTLAERLWQDSRASDDPIALAGWQAWTELQVRQQRIGAARILDQALRSSGTIDTVDAALDQAYFYAQSGRPDDARYWTAADRRVSNRYASLPAPQRAAEDAWVEGTIAYGEGRFDDAVAYLQQAERDYDSFYPTLGGHLLSWDLARAYDLAGMADSAIARYEVALGYGDILETGRQAMEYPITLIRLAERYDEKGDLERAAGYYGRFVELWADADPDLQPRVEAAQARLDEIVRERG
ncbi:MAG: tetratricopeptide repeat protein [Gemmatimonadetes bacterium]|nr:tetratricopeptide repeat protein [Gemmatimonadota bacterium]